MGNKVFVGLIKKNVETNFKILSKSETYISPIGKRTFNSYKGGSTHPKLFVRNRINLRTDHSAIKYLFTTCNIKGRLARWSLLLQEFDVQIEYLPGKNNSSDF